MDGDLVFQAFVRRWDRDFRALAKMSQGEKEVGDLVSDAWLLSFEVAAKRGHPFDFENLQDQHQLMRWLNFEVNRKADLAFRFAERPDGCEEDINLWDMLPAAVTADPLERLIADEDLVYTDDLRARSYSEYVAYCLGWMNTGQALVDLAQHLAITAESLVQRLRRAQAAKDRQASLFDTVEKIPKNFVPKPGRARTRLQACEIVFEQCTLEV